ncbi:MAG: DHHA1 domain-containing protein [Chloroflexota bacterium]
MNEPIYYTDAYQTTFESEVIETLEENGRFGLILNQTAFYPTSGGQPFDTGKLNNQPVLDVTNRKSDKSIIHWFENPFEVANQVTGEINWERRFDHMQQHTGQHMLSQAFIQLANAPTIGFHLSPKTVTIDLDINELAQEKIDEVEQYVNQIVWENRPIHIKFVTLEEAQSLNVRKLPPVAREKIRLVDITNFDLTACGGTHVTSTGSVGMIKIIKSERQNKKVRITFACGSRALTDYGQKNQITSALTQSLTTGLDDLVPNISRLQGDVKQLQKDKKQLQTKMIGYQADEIAATAESIGGYQRIIHVMPDGNPAILRTLAQNLTQIPNTVVFLAVIVGGKTQLLLSSAEDVSLDMTALLKAVVADLGSGSGGGKGHTVQGGTAVTDAQKLTQAFTQVSQAMLKGS